MKPVIRHSQAGEQIDALAYYIARENVATAYRFLEAIENSIEMLRKHPGIGSSRYAHLLPFKGLRLWPVQGFEHHLIFYIERPDVIDVLRVLHVARDVPAILGEG